MALPGTCIWEVQTDGSDTANAGCFDPANTFMATDLTATAANTATPEVASASYNFQSSDVGAHLFIKSGTNWIPGWYIITSVDANKATVNAAIGQAVLYTTMQASTLLGCATVATQSANKATWTVDYSQRGGVGSAITEATAVGAGSTLTHASIGKNWVGNGYVSTGGTNVTTGIFIVASTSTTTATLTAPTATAITTDATSNAAGGMGGALASPRKATDNTADENRVWVKSGTYDVTGTSDKVYINRAIKVMGYSNFRGDYGCPVLRATATGVNIVDVGTSAYGSISNFEINGQDYATVNGVYLSYQAADSYYTLFNLNIHNCVTGVACSANFRNIPAILCKAYSCSGYGFTNCNAFNCVSYSNALSGFLYGSCKNCIAYLNTGYGFYNVFLTANCVAYHNTLSGWYIQGYAQIWSPQVFNCISSANHEYGFADIWSRSRVSYVNCKTYNNTSGIMSGGSQEAATELTGDPFVDAANGDFRLNNLPGGGALCRAAGIGPVGQTSCIDIGAVASKGIFIED